MLIFIFIFIFILMISMVYIIYMAVKLAEVTLLPEKLSVVVSTIETVFMGHIIWWADETSSMGASKTNLVVRFSVNGHLKDNHKREI